MNKDSKFVKSDDIPWTSVGDGVRRKILCHTKELMMVRVDFVAGAVGAVHSHPHIQGSIVEKGSFDVTIGKETKTLSAGDAFIIDADVPHGVVAREAGTLLDTFSPMREDFL